jgi:hypothetical protein
VAIGASYSYNLVASDADGDPLTYDFGSLPPGASAAGSSLSWTPSVGQAGEYSLAVTVRDDRGGSAVQAWTVFVDDPGNNAAPDDRQRAAGPRCRREVLHASGAGLRRRRRHAAPRS